MPRPGRGARLPSASARSAAGARCEQRPGLCGPEWGRSPTSFKRYGNAHMVRSSELASMVRTSQWRRAPGRHCEQRAAQQPEQGSSLLRESDALRVYDFLLRRGRRSVSAGPSLRNAPLTGSSVMRGAEMRRDERPDHSGQATLSAPSSTSYHGPLERVQRTVCAAWVRCPERPFLGSSLHPGCDARRRAPSRDGEF